jgi:nitrogenase iron protein NifH
MDELEEMLMEFGILKSDEEMIAELEAKEAAQKEAMAVA